MKVYSGSGLGSMYFQLIRDITEHGRKVTIRGNDCLELPERVCLEYTAPGHCWMRIPGRKFNPFLALAEVVWILSGNGNAEWIAYFGSNMKNYLDEGETDFHGAYGVRIRGFGSWFKRGWTDQIKCVVMRLQEESTSRQAVISLWDPLYDNEPSKDIPCNNLIYYELRDGVLSQTVVIRSNDVVWGTPYNAVQFSHIHAYVAGLLGARIGTLTYVIQNLHYYLDLYKPTLTNLIEQAYDENTSIVAEEIPSFGPFNDSGLNYLKQYVEISLHNYHNLDLPFPPDDEYTDKIASVLRLYIKIKIGGGSELNYSSMGYLSTIEQPLRDLIADFWEDSKNQIARQVSEFLRRNNDVAA